MTAAEKAMTLRLSRSLAFDLQMVATVDGHTQTDVVRVALAAHLAARRSDPGFQAKAAALVARMSATGDDITVQVAS